MSFNLINGLVDLPIEEIYSFSSSSTTDGQWKIQFPRPKSNKRSAFSNCRAGTEFFQLWKKSHITKITVWVQKLSTGIFRVCLRSLSFSFLHRVFSYLFLPSLSSLISLLPLLYEFPCTKKYIDKSGIREHKETRNYRKRKKKET